ncbi:hypothetical protein BpHYR1_044796 [Brachionus plicatilis]|uniref:Uncharacterized protein n=1 Tax=Brachionus plicatilis TaxID=10195 RepID=A0A3M7PM72_BRAPC|nr:hypothetical protein BpHYR1_044796 [Brachionus plicatilis]
MINNTFLLNSKTKNFDLKLTFDHELQFANKLNNNSRFFRGIQVRLNANQWMKPVRLQQKCSSFTGGIDIIHIFIHKSHKSQVKSKFKLL